MRKYQLFVFYICCIWLIHSHSTNETKLNEKEAGNKYQILFDENCDFLLLVLEAIDSLPDCSEFKSDGTIIASFPFYIPLNPYRSRKMSTTYGTIDVNGHIDRLNIVNQKFIPSTIFCLKYLERLQVQNTCLYHCTHEPSNGKEYFFPPSLIDLSISNTNMIHLSEQRSKLTNLQSLQLSNVGFTYLSDSIRNLISLKTLYLSHNNLTSLPRSIKYLRSLQQLTLKSNLNLRSLQQLNGLSSLKILDARHCSIDKLPRDLPQLIDLYMSNNKLKSLDGIHTLGYGTYSRKSFYFDMNYILSISPNIRYVKNLFRLNLNQNNLSSLPLDIFHMKTLHDLSIDNNSIYNDKLKEKIMVRFNISLKSKPRKL